MDYKQTQKLDFFGKSIAMPYNISSTFENGKTETISGEEHIKQIIDISFRTRKFARPMRRRLGFNSERIVFDPILSSLRAQVEYNLKDSFSRFKDNRIEIKSVDIDWKNSKGTSIYFLVEVYDKTDKTSKTISHLWDYLR